MDNKPDKIWKRTRERMYRSVESCHPIISDTSDIRNEKKGRWATVKEFLLLFAAFLLLGFILIAIMSL